MSSLLERLKRVRIVRAFVYAIVGAVSYPGLVWVNRLKISGTENIKNLPPRTVLFVSNHQTYFADVITFLHIFCAVKLGKKNRLGIPYYLLNPFTSVYYVAAEETMKGSWISRFFTLAGPIVIPVVINGFWRAFNKKGLKFKRKGSQLSVTFKKPMEIDYEAPTEKILAQVMDAIEQSKSHMMQGAHHWKTIDN